MESTDDYSYELVGLFSRLIQRLNFMKLDYDYLTKAIKVLEGEFGDIPIFSIADPLPEEHKKKRYRYMIKELLDSTQYVLSYFNRRAEETPIFTKTGEKSYDVSLSKVGAKIWKRFLPSKDEAFLTRYCWEWEMLYKTLINPIYRYLKQSQSNFLLKQIDPLIKGRARHVVLVKCFLSSRLDMNQLLFIPNNMNTYVRNALTHNTFYIDDRIKPKKICYYDLFSSPVKIKEITMDNLELHLINLIISRIIVFVTIGERISAQLGFEWKL